MPDDLFDMWLKPEIESNGWPFSGNETVMPNSTWAKYLRNHLPSFWRGVRWHRVSQTLVGVAMEKRAENIAHQLACFARKFSETGLTPPALIKGSLPKILALAAITNTDGQLPKPLVCLVQNSGEWWLMDGHHRLAALYMLGRQDIPFDCWLGTHDP